MEQLKIEQHLQNNTYLYTEMSTCMPRFCHYKTQGKTWNQA